MPSDSWLYKLHKSGNGTKISDNEKDAQLKPNIYLERKKRINGYFKKHKNHECLVTVMMYHVFNKFQKKKLEFTTEVWVFSLFCEF